MEISFDRNEILGVGGYGIVFKGKWLDQPVAVKRIELITQLTSDEKEETILRELDHENVINIFHTESDADFKYFALELCEASLDKLFLEDGDAKIYMGPIPSPEDSLRQMATGLAYIHSREIVHCDVKPENVLISIKNNIAIMKWADFGLSKFVNEKGSFAHSVLSVVNRTMKWIAPELLEILNKDFSTQSTAETSGDVFAEGSVFAYFLSGGQHPFGSSSFEILINVLENNPVNLTTKSIPSYAAITLISKMLAKNPGDRISSSDVVTELVIINDQLKNDLKEVDSMIPSVNKTNNLLGRGGFTGGKEAKLEGVWEGVWRRHKVAIKIMNLNDYPLCHEREKNLLKLNHPNVIKMYHIETNSVYRYFSLELCAASLDKLFLKDDDPKKYRPKLSNGQSINMPPPQDVFSQLAEGMAHIHEMKLSHRDVKPLNVLIHVPNKSDGNHKVTMKWADFGASKVIRDTGDISMSGWKFTHKWCAPEILKIYNREDSKPDEKKAESVFIEGADVFSEGMIFSYYLLEGEHPYGNWPDQPSNIMNNKPINLHNIPTEHQELKKLIEEMLKTKPTDRPSSKKVAEKLALLASPTFISEEHAASDSSSSSNETLTIQFKREDIIGIGQTGMVFKGKYGTGGPDVAVKRIQLIECDVNQERSLLNLNHPNIVTILGVENDENFKYIAMELCAGSLAQLFLPDNDPRKYKGKKPNCFELMYQLALGLEYIHSNQILYRNFQPENVLISVDTTGKKLTMKWADFGFTKPKSKESLSISRNMEGYKWSAPELILFSFSTGNTRRGTTRGTVKSEVFAEGLIFGYFLLKGRHLFGNHCFNIMKNNMVNIKEIKSNCCLDLILKMLEPNPAHRINSSEVVRLITSQRDMLELKLFDLLEETPLNMNQIENVIDEGVNINCVDENGLTPFLRLIQSENGDLLQVIPLLLERGVDVNHKDAEDEWNALYFLCYYHQQKDSLTEIISLLIDHKIDVNCKDKEGKNILHWLCENYEKDNLSEIIRLLIERGKFELDQKGPSKENILHFYCQKYKKENFIDIVKIFADNGVEVVSEDVDARRFITNKKFPKRQNPQKIIELMNEKM